MGKKNGYNTRWERRGPDVADVNELTQKISNGSINFCQNCTISIYSCRISDAFIEGLGKATGCTVTGSAGACKMNDAGAGWVTDANKAEDLNQFRKSVAGKPATNAGHIHVPVLFR